MADGRMEINWACATGPGVLEEGYVRVPTGSTIEQVLAAAGFANVQACGVWGKQQPPDTVVQAGDRVESYRPLKVDPKVARRERFSQQGARASGLFAKRRANSKAGY